MSTSILSCTLSTILFVAPFVPGQDKANPPPDPPARLIAPVPALVEFAKQNAIEISRIEPGDEVGRPRAGDRITMLVTLYHGPSTRQWLAIVTQDTLTEKEREMNPLPEEVLYSSTGREMHFTNTRTALSVQFVGPFSGDGGATDDELNEQ